MAVLRPFQVLLNYISLKFFLIRGLGLIPQSEHWPKPRPKVGGIDFTLRPKNKILSPNLHDLTEIKLMTLENWKKKTPTNFFKSMLSPILFPILIQIC